MDHWIESYRASEQDAMPEMSQDDIRTLPMLYRASREFAVSFNNPVINAFLEKVPDLKCKYSSFDIKVCMLKRGWWPCIPGWHLDDFHRGLDGQPDLVNLEKYSCRHFMTILGDVSLTEFFSGNLPLPPFVLDMPVYGWYNKIIEERKSKMNIQTVEPSKIYMFTQNDFHRGVEATGDGWRAFLRLTQSNHRQPKNEIRSQVQVYVPQADFFRGW